ncbi:oligogalacturonide lyase [Neolewinella xylanilytica]|uniref:Oligogalacturonide lyase n=1 Tax=Neolewinella xylanilytica TaxID=1514080 RepID=A0A2S6I403_9BACT|nr:oligogalacturonate lyase family protein [Neolewinella xylanilytica]PPK85893.1 oligogalacturonide lyase [Neolewinella xylanilytica]
MKHFLGLLVLFSLGVSAQGDPPVLMTGEGGTMPGEWIDETTGHRLVRLTDADDTRSFYFHNDPFLPTADGQDNLMVYYGEVDGDLQLFTLNLQTKETAQLTTQPGRKHGEIVAKNRREVFYQIRDTVFATHVDTKVTREVFVFPDDFKAWITTLNADETKLAGTWSSPEKDSILEAYPKKSEFFERIFDAEILHKLFVVDVDNGFLEPIHSEQTWLGHVQFSTTDPNTLMFCHEGPWHKVDRIWNIDLATKDITKIHERTVHREIAGHEFWSRDGNTIWYDLQIPRGETFYLAGYDTRSKELRKYAMDRNEWSIHFTISPDQQVFAGDGGDPSQVAGAEDGRYIYLFEPRQDSLASTKLVNMQHHDYQLEPNVHFTPDQQWIVFRANFEGSSHIYAVAIKPYP